MQQANVDAAEVAKFEKLAHRWWDPQSEFKPLHEINPLRLGYIEEHVSLNGQRVVDIGCGGGILSESMAAKGADVLGIDMGETPLSVAKLHQLESGVEVEYRQCTAESLAAEMLSFAASSTVIRSSTCSTPAVFLTTPSATCRVRKVGTLPRRMANPS